MEEIKPTTSIIESVLSWSRTLEQHGGLIPVTLCLTGPYRRILNVVVVGDQLKFRLVADQKLQDEYDEAMEVWTKDPGSGEQPEHKQIPFKLIRLGDITDGLWSHSMSVAAEIDDVLILTQTSEHTVFGGSFGNPFGGLF